MIAGTALLFGRVAIVVLALATTLAGCPRPRTPANPTNATRVVLTVQNNHRADIVVYVVGDGQATRVGTATAAMTTTFDIPAHLLSQGRELRLRADPVGTRSVHTSEVIRVSPGQRITWTLETDLSRSSVAVYS